MSLRKTLANLWIYLTTGYGPASLGIGIANSIMLFIIYLKNMYGIQTPIYLVIGVFLVGVGAILFLGYIWYTRGFQKDIMTIQNENNKEFIQMRDWMGTIDERLALIQKEASKK